MRRASNSSGDEMANLVASLIFSILLVFGIAVFGLVWLAFSAGYRFFERQALMGKPQAVFEQVRSETYPDLQIDPLLQSIFGPGLDLQPNHVPSRDDWATHALFGV